MPLPNFLTIGAAKSGTTSLYYYLRQHPDIYMSPIKEPRFFARDRPLPAPEVQEAQQRRHPIVTGLSEYLALFDGVTHESAVGEASTVYLYHPQAAAGIQATIPEAKVLAILRHPVERAYSHFLANLRDGDEPLQDFAAALQAEPARIREHWYPGWHYAQRGLYAGQLQRYLGRFSAQQIKVYLYEEFAAQPRSVLQEIWRFLGVDATFAPDISVRYNRSGLPRSRALHSLLKRRNALTHLLASVLTKERLLRAVVALNNRNLRQAPPLSQEVRSALLSFYRDDTLTLQDLIQRDLSAWLR